jgi:hypothetical protein
MVAEPIWVLPSKKFTVPLGATLDVDVTVAVNVTEEPYTDGFTPELTSTVEGASTSWLRTPLALPRIKVAGSPLKVAVMECAPSISVEVVYVAVPPALSGTVVSAVLPSMKVTVPSGVTPPPLAPILTVALKVTGEPTAEGLALDVTVVDVPSFTTCTNGAFELSLAK